MTPGHSNGWTFEQDSSTASGVKGSATIKSTTETGGNGALLLSTPTKDSYTTIFKSAGNVPLSNINLYSYMTKRIAGAAHAAPSVYLYVDKDGNSATTDDLVYIFYEPNYNNGSDYNNWNTWTVSDSSILWSSGKIGIIGGDKGGSSAAGRFTLGYVKEKHPQATVVEYGFNMGPGGGNATWQAWVDKFSINGSLIADFENEAPTLTVATPREGTIVGTKKGNVIKLTGKFTDDVQANYAEFELVNSANTLVTQGIVYGDGPHYNPTATYADANGNYTYDLTVPADLPSGEYSLFYRGTDHEDGSTARMERKIIIDNENPETDIHVSSVVDGKFTVYGTAKDYYRLNRVYVQLVSRVTGQRCGGTTVHMISDNTNNKTWSVDYDIATLGANCPEGDYSAHVEVTDMAGNRGTAGWTNNFAVTTPTVVDPTDPVIPVDPTDPTDPVDPTDPGNPKPSEGGEVNPILTGPIPGVPDLSGNPLITSQPIITPLTVTTPIIGTTGVPYMNTILNGQESTETDDPSVLATEDNKLKNSDKDSDVLADTDSKDGWSVVNVVLAGLTAILSVIALTGIASREDGKRIGARLTTVVIAVGAVVAILFTENFSLPMIWLNWWTILYAMLFVLQAMVKPSSRKDLQ